MGIVYIIIGYVITLTLVIIIATCFWRLPQKLQNALLSSMVLCFLAILVAFFMVIILQNALPYRNIQARKLAIYLVVFFITAAMLVSLAFVVTYRVKDEEKVRRIFFWVSIAVFTAVYIGFLIQAVEGFIQRKYTLLPGALCRQLSFAFPIIYFSKNKLRKLLPSVCVISFAFGFVAGVPSLVNLESNVSGLWSRIDVFFLHIFMTSVPAAIYVKKELHFNKKDLLYLTLVYAFIWTVAYIFNWINYLQYGTLGGYGFDTRESYKWVKTWMVVIFQYIGLFITMYAIIIAPKIFGKEQDKN